MLGLKMDRSSQISALISFAARYQLDAEILTLGNPDTIDPNLRAVTT